MDSQDGVQTGGSQSGCASGPQAMSDPIETMDSLSNLSVSHAPSSAYEPEMERLKNGLGVCQQDACP